MNDNYYLDKDGNTIFRSSFYRKKGSCCKSSCLHCPFGHTLKNHGLKTIKINESNSKSCIAIFDYHNNKDQAVQSLLDSAFGSVKKSFDIANSYALTLKDNICGVVTISSDNKISDFFLHKEFLDQGINESHVTEAIENLNLQK